MKRGRRSLMLRGMAILCQISLPAFVGCGRKSIAQRDPFLCFRNWQVSHAGRDFAVTAKLQPEPLRADKPAMLETRFRALDSNQPFPGRLWYRFAHRRGDPLPLEMELAVRPPKTYEEGSTPHYDDRFVWAEIVDPRIENDEVVFSTPVMFPEGKSYVQFRIASQDDTEPQELLDWFVYVDPAD